MSDPKTEEAQKREIRNRRQFSLRLNIFFFATFFAFSLLIVRLAFLQFVEGPSLKEQEQTLSTRPVSIPPIRGNIYDSDGQPIAYSTSTQSLYFTLETGYTKEEGRALAAKLVDIFNKYGDKSKPPLTVDEVFDDMDFDGKVHLPYQQRRIKSGLTQQEIAYFSEHKDEFKGIDIVEESIRQYSPDRVAVQLVGYMKKLSGATSLDKYKNVNQNQTDPTLKYLDSEEVGFDGLELMYQDELRGRNGLKTYPVDSMSRIIGPMQLTKPVKGNNLYLTINRHVQLAAQKAITDQLYHLQHETRPGTVEYEGHKAETGYAVAMEVDTGKVIAMASIPDYDPNIWQGGINQKELDDITYAMSNGTIRDVQPPYNKDPKEVGKHPSSFVYLGSTQKPLSILIGLNEKLITPSTEWYDPGEYRFGSKGHEVTIQNASHAVNGWLTPWKAIAKSSNAFMASQIGNGLYNKYKGKKGIDVWDQYMKEFGLGVLTGSGLPKESPGKVDYYHEAENASVQSALIRASFGQMGKYSTLQLAQYAVMLATHGERLKPQFVEKITDAEGNTIQTFHKEVLGTVHFPEIYWKTIEQGMAQVKIQGFDDAPYSVLRKTGTSQQDVKGGRVENAVFIAYAPADHPKLAVAVVVPEGGYGGWGASPIARKIFDAYDEAVGLYGKPRQTNANADPTGGAASGAAVQSGQAQAGQGSRP